MRRFQLFRMYSTYITRVNLSGPHAIGTKACLQVNTIPFDGHCSGLFLCLAGYDSAPGWNPCSLDGKILYVQ